MKKTKFTLKENEVLISKNNNNEIKVSYKLILFGMLGAGVLYFLGYQMGVFIGNIIFAY